MCLMDTDAGLILLVPQISVPVNKIVELLKYPYLNINSSILIL
jgi:hypothetical protein